MIYNSKMTTFNVGWSVLAERQGVRSNHQHRQLAEHQSEHSHDQSFLLGLVQEVGWTVRSHRNIQIIREKAAGWGLIKTSQIHLKILDDPLVNPWQNLFFLVRTARINMITSYRERQREFRKQSNRGWTGWRTRFRPSDDDPRKELYCTVQKLSDPAVSYSSSLKLYNLT